VLKTCAKPSTKQWLSKTAEITKGEIVGLLGQNGASKSTTIRFCLVDYCHLGEVTMFGLNPGKRMGALTH
jgi:ABC-type multidrug transport system ATPase subunit